MISRRTFLTFVPILTGLGFSKIITTLQNEPRKFIEPDDHTNWDWWRQLPRIPVTSSADPNTNTLCRAAAEKRLVSILYNAAPYLGVERRILPLSVFKVEGYDGTYVHAFCTLRNAERTFRIDRIYQIFNVS